MLSTLDIAPVEFGIRNSGYTLPTGFLSPSQVLTYSLCPSCYMEQYLNHRPRTISIALPLGSGVHAGFAVARLAAMAEASVDEATVLDYGMDRFTRGVSGEDPLDPDPPGEVLPDYGVEEIRTAMQHVQEILRSHVQPIVERDRQAGILEVEQPVAYDGTFPFPFKGYLDLRVRDGIDELKTAARKGTPDLGAAFQVACYSLPAFKREGQVTGLTITKIVKTQTSYVQTFPVRTDAERMEGVYQDILQTATDISAGRFPVGPGRFGQHDFQHARPAAYSFGAS